MSQIKCPICPNEKMIPVHQTSGYAALYHCKDCNVRVLVGGKSAVFDFDSIKGKEKHG